jgi:hypothetical protein
MSSTVGISTNRLYCEDIRTNLWYCSHGTYLVLVLVKYLLGDVLISLLSIRLFANDIVIMIY